MLFLDGIVFIGAACFVLLPFVIFHLVYLRYKRSFETLSFRFGSSNALAMSGVVSVIAILLFAIFSFQPNRTRILDQMVQILDAKTFEDRQKISLQLENRQSELKDALQLIQNARTKYLFVKADTTLAQAYQSVFKMPESLANLIQQGFLLTAYPFTYQGETKYTQEYNQAFEYLYGTPPYYSTNPATKQVHLISRKIVATSDETQLFATISVDDVFKNPSFTDQEVIYEFSLPNGSVITDLKLGPSLEYPGQVAPRGAAQLTYQTELSQRRDPALLEQTGPRQYRLRVFPIPPFNSNRSLNGQIQRVQFTYMTPITSHGYGLPKYSKESNLNIGDAEILTTLNEQSIASNENYLSTNNLPNGCDIQPSLLKAEVSGFEFDLIDHQANSLYACDQETKVPSLSSKDILVMIDMSAKQEDLSFDPKDLLINQFSSEFLKNNNVELVSFNDLISTSQRIASHSDIDQLNLVYFGAGLPITKLTQIASDYDVAILISQNQKTWIDLRLSDIKTRTPLYILHPTKIPAYSQEATEAIVKSRGSVVDSIQEALTLYAMHNDQPSRITFPFWSFDFRSLEEDNSIPSVTTSADNPFSYQVAWAYVMNQIAADTSLDSPEKDGLHALAKASQFASPYSSMIALVNSTQQLRLDNNSLAADRYEEQWMVTNQSNTVGSIARSGILNPAMPLLERPTVSNLRFPTAAGGHTSTRLGADTMSGMSYSSLGGVGLSGSFGALILGLPLILGMVYSLFKQVRKK